MMRVGLARLFVVVSLLVLAATGIAMQAMPHHVLGAVPAPLAMHGAGAAAEHGAAGTRHHGAEAHHPVDGAQPGPGDGGPRHGPDDCPFCRIAASWTPTPALRIARPLTATTTIPLPSQIRWAGHAGPRTYTARAPPVA